MYVQAYFCGQHPECVRFDSEVALRRAKENVEKHYPVVSSANNICQFPPNFFLKK